MLISSGFTGFCFFQAYFFAIIWTCWPLIFLISVAYHLNQTQMHKRLLSLVAAQLWVLPVKLLSFPCNPMPNVCLLQDLILLWDLMSDIYQVSCRSPASEEIILCWLTESGCISVCCIRGGPRTLLIFVVVEIDGSLDGVYVERTSFFSFLTREANAENVGPRRLARASEAMLLLQHCCLTSCSGKQEQVNSVRQLSQTS